MSRSDKPLLWLSEGVKTPPFSSEAGFETWPSAVQAYAKNWTVLP